jgi:hypothetical protein
VLRTVTALEQAPDIATPSSYLIYDRKVIPTWAVRLFVLSLILPAIAVTVDGYARARRRGYAVSSWIRWVLAAALPFAAVAGLALVLGLTGVMPAAPPGPVGAGAVPLHAGGIAILVGLAVLLLGAAYSVRRFAPALAGARGDPSEGGAAVAVLVVMCACALAMWLVNPFAAGLVVPALNLWLWVVEPDLGLRAPFAFALLALGIAPPVLELVYYAHAFGLGPVGLGWSGAMLVAGGQLGVPVTFECCVLAGCLASIVTIVIEMARRGRPEDLPVTVRGPVTYAGPGSLGGTESALRR